jgi:hypothetical protein
MELKRIREAKASQESREQFKKKAVMQLTECDSEIYNF